MVLYTIAALISLAGLADATYLTVTHLTGESVLCGGSSDCSKVLGSIYASVAGFPLAGMGAVAYFVTFSCATLAAFGYHRARMFLIGFVAAMVIVTLWLFYVQAFVLHAFCRFCLLSGACTFALAGVVVAAKPGRFERTG